MKLKIQVKDKSNIEAKQEPNVEAKQEDKSKYTWVPWILLAGLSIAFIVKYNTTTNYREEEEPQLKIKKDIFYMK